MGDKGTATELSASEKTLFEGLLTPDSPESKTETVDGPEPSIPVIPLDDSRGPQGFFILTVPPTSESEKASRWMKQLAKNNQIQLPDDLIDRVAKSAVYPTTIDGSTPNRLRTEHGWLLTLETRLLTPLVNVSVANDRWVADVVYAADPESTDSDLHAVPLPTSETDYASLNYNAATEELLEAANENFHRVLGINPQDVGRRLIEQPVTLVATHVGSSGAGEDAVELAAVDGNCRISSAFSKIKISPDVLPTHIRDKPELFEKCLTPALLANLTLTERRTLARRLAKDAQARLAVAPVAALAHGYLTDLRERNSAASTLNVLTIPARLIVGFIDDEPAYGMSRFASAVRDLLMQMNVEGKPLEESARHAIGAEEIVLALYDENIIDQNIRDVLLGRSDVAEPMKAIGLNHEFPDLRAAFVLQVFCGNSESFRTVLKERLDKAKIYASDRSRPAVELAIRSYTASMAPEELKKARLALETGAIWPDLVNKPWEVVDIDSDEMVDILAMLARDQREEGDGPLLRLLGVLGMIALVTTGHLLAPRGSAEQIVGSPIDRGSIATIISKFLRFDWGITLLADAIKCARSGQPLRWINTKTGQLVEADADWGGADFDANLRLLAKREGLQEAVIPGSGKERLAWTGVAEAVKTARDKVSDFGELRDHNGTTAKLPWHEVDGVQNNLTWMSRYISGLSELPPED